MQRNFCHAKTQRCKDAKTQFFCKQKSHSNLNCKQLFGNKITKRDNLKRMPKAFSFASFFNKIEKDEIANGIDSVEAPTPGSALA